MRALVVQMLLVMALPMLAIAQDDEQWPPFSDLRNDYRRVSVVAQVRVREAEIVNRIGGYEDWRLVGEVMEPFKGKFRKGDTIEFYHGAEAGFRKESFLGDQIVFLQRHFTEKERRWVWAVLENSSLRYAPNRVRNLRIIRYSLRKKKQSSSQAQPHSRFRPSCCLHLISV